ncbi:hypothetical protein AWB91_05075 [Mycobacterium paraense]|uniref:N-acetyltransferase domain-containing protein n=1 Tax=Mycobacterium paraense TaxID=767916 RepID=A0A1X2AFZ9_9MYCO|nr:hypothetical protein [Mycobacterium paraense]MCV7442523.1 hypothetical protein [Mycobacterium paraense]ORW26832.1 hypothetical protein AWB91_05075 [Mycobacterium paraense]ORW43472.1 hypothetical protein AWB88_07925 [Mycobacterium paraense]ORW45143.1 hypothetical protein AWB89_00675 [Mycobacterium paraense]ORW50314.1 hypothetical protein AWB90_07150 [Mycobacterium paraense]
MAAAQLTSAAIKGSWLEGGAGWRDQATGCWVAASTPEADPELWEQYLDGAFQSYRRHGLEWVLDVDAVRDGTDTALFFAAIDPGGRVVGGTRVVGPLQTPEDSHALDEWDGNPGAAVLRYMIANRIPFGVVEVKSAWANSQEYGSRALSRVLARTALPMMTLMGVQFVMATAAAHVLEQWRSSGGVVASRIPAAAYPNDNYRTKVMWWDRRTLATHAEPDQFKLMCAEDAVILGRASA